MIAVRGRAISTACDRVGPDCSGQRPAPARRATSVAPDACIRPRRMARPLVRADQPRRAAPPTSRMRATKAPAARRCWPWSRRTRTGTGSTRVLPALERRRRARAGRARTRRSSCASSTTRAASCCSRAFSTSASCRDRAAHGSRSSSTTRSRSRCSSARRSPRPLEVFVKVNTGMNRLGFAAGDGAPASASGCRHSPVGRGAAADDASSRAPTRTTASRSRSRRSRRRASGLPYPRSLANSAGVIRYRGSRRRHRAAGHHALRRVAVSVRHGATMLGLAAGDDAALAAHRDADAESRTTASVMAEPTRRRARIASASSPAATPTAIRGMRRTARRCSSAARRRGWPDACRWT